MKSKLIEKLDGEPYENSRRFADLKKRIIAKGND
jgi:hypothetical protein